MAKKFAFKRNQSVGAAQAELDEHYLDNCFIDTGDLAILTNCDDSRRIIAGRTGSGKSALIAKIIESKENVIQIRPESLSLTYIANSGVINFFTEAGVKMDIFYRLLWRHVFVVEILKERFHIETEDAKKGFLNFLWQLIPKNKKHELAIDYLKKWGESFWKETEYRVHEITKKLEKELEASIGGGVEGLGILNAAAARKLTEEQKEEVVNRAQEVVSSVQIVELSRVMELLDDVLLADPQRKFLIVIDQLDEDWVEDRLRFRLIRALIETSIDFARIRNMKIILALRNDLLDRVYRYTRDSGFQEEKYRTSTLPLIWTKKQLTELLDARISQLVFEQYTSQAVSHKDLLPKEVEKQVSIDYMLDRTLMRPRDIIQFFNTCIQLSEGRPVISLKVLRESEGTYSRERLRALADEWYGLYPNLLHLASLIKRRRDIFLVQDITNKQLIENYLELLISGRGEEGLDMQLMNMVFEGAMSIEDYKINVILIFYKVGLVGLKTERQVPFSWSEAGPVSVSSAEIKPDTKVSVHKAFWRSLGIAVRNSSNEDEQLTITQ